LVVSFTLGDLERTFKTAGSIHMVDGRCEMSFLRPYLYRCI
jgi:hypothetical protein